MVYRALREWEGEYGTSIRDSALTHIRADNGPYTMSDVMLAHGHSSSPRRDLPAAILEKCDRPPLAGTRRLFPKKPILKYTVVHLARMGPITHKDCKVKTVEAQEWRSDRLRMEPCLLSTVHPDS